MGIAAFVSLTTRGIVASTIVFLFISCFQVLQFNQNSLLGQLHGFQPVIRHGCPSKGNGFLTCCWRPCFSLFGIKKLVGYSFGLLDRLLGLISATEINGLLEIWREGPSEPEKIFLFLSAVWIIFVHVLLDPCSQRVETLLAVPHDCIFLSPPVVFLVWIDQQCGKLCFGLSPSGSRWVSWDNLTKDSPCTTVHPQLYPYQAQPIHISR